MRKTFAFLRKPILILLGLVISFLLLSATVNAVWTAAERNSYNFPGKYVEISGKKIHTYTVGSGDTNVVLLSGLGTPSPMLDFLPLIRELATKFRVTVIEYPGYGLSDDSDRSRATSESVEEIRAVLREIDIAPPYILAPHSISGLQALLYSNKYPKEVAGVIGLDISVPKQLDYVKLSSVSANLRDFYIYKFLRISGIIRIALWVDPNLNRVKSIGLSVEDAKKYNMITNWTIASHAIFNELNSVPQNMKSLWNEKFPLSTPVTLVLASENVNRVGPGIPGDVWKRIHEEIIENGINSKIVVLNGNHYIYHGNEKKIADLVSEMSETIKANY